MRLAKISITALCAVAVILALILLPARLCFSGGEDYTFYCGTSSADCREVTVKNNPSLARLGLRRVCGEATVYEDFDLDRFLTDVGGKIVFVEKLSDSMNYYCTADLPYSVNLYGAEINLHICVRNEFTKVASPIIFGGY